MLNNMIVRNQIRQSDGRVRLYGSGSRTARIKIGMHRSTVFDKRTARQ